LLPPFWAVLAPTHRNHVSCGGGCGWLRGHCVECGHGAAVIVFEQMGLNPKRRRHPVVTHESADL
jgi:hypothetical protein